MSEWFKVGKIVNTHGVKGEVRVIASTDFTEDRFASGQELMVIDKETKSEVKVKVTGHRKHKNFDLLTFDGYTNINHVERFKGEFLYVHEAFLDELDKYEYYYHEIIGCLVKTEEGQELGKVREILETGANDVWIVQRIGQGKDILIPYIEQVVKQVDVEAKVITIHAMEGLIDEN
ncbi:ribosome maturation factor RimM [Alkalihalobacillus pseudalcaliphilus]|uniref:ribosome maturation factor RimM n=1 Tax=Alkalihalobacillus pseudalcaliphilus TaxID=79884 RepID=UPI00064DDA12|nr:ribosome maturation factor RimM [Alkalihalobacillus pseudalcaliphilus]KMK77187.1 16S rRNA processing protein RimM [Alkalihalobacillus pseudalcaliphilus]